MLFKSPAEQPPLTSPRQGERHTEERMSKTPLVHTEREREGERRRRSGEKYQHSLPIYELSSGTGTTHTIKVRVFFMQNSLSLLFSLFLTFSLSLSLCPAMCLCPWISDWEIDGVSYRVWVNTCHTTSSLLMCVASLGQCETKSSFGISKNKIK